MALILKDRVKQESTTTGTGTVTLGATYAGYQSFATAVPDGDVVYYTINNTATGTTEWEVGIGTFTLSGTTLSRDTVLDSTNSGSLVDFAAGIKEVFVTYPAEKAIYEEEDGTTVFRDGHIRVIDASVTSYTSFTATLGEFVSNLNSYSQLYVQNINSGSDASTDITAYNDLGDGTDYFVDMGISSSNYTSVDYPIFQGNDAYLYTKGADAVANRLLIGTEAPSSPIVFFAGGVDVTDEVARFTASGNVLVGTSTDGGYNLEVAGTSKFTGNALFGGTVTLNAGPTLDLQAATKAYVDSAVATGFIVHDAVILATAAALPANTYDNGTGGVGATLTANANGALSIDGTAVNTNDRVLIKNEVASQYNGSYDVTQTGDAGTPYILTRTSDFDAVGPGEVATNAYFYVTDGSANISSAWIFSQLGPFTIGTTPFHFELFSQPAAYIGTAPINVTGQTISLTGTVAATNGGTGTNTVATGDLLYGSGTNTWGKLAAGAGYKSLVMNGSGTNVE